MTARSKPVQRGTTAEQGSVAALRTIDSNIAAFGDLYPDDTTVGGVYRPRARAGHPDGANLGWTTSFWPGVLWLAHDLTGEERYGAAAAAHVASFVERVHGGVDLETHDLGFLYTLSCVVPWRRTGDAEAREAALAAADHLMTRFLEPAGIIQAWGDLSNPAQAGRTIIDSLMNMPLLYWASEETGSPGYADAARRHTAQLRDHIIRPDNTTFHTFYWDVESGAPLRGATQQGHSDDSCWARGQAWGIYGFTLSHRYTGDESFLHAAERCAAYFLDHLPDDDVAYWDLVFTDGSDQPRDSSAAAIAACGLDELAGLVADPAAADRYRTAARGIVDSLVLRYATAPDGRPQALLRHSVYDMPKNVGVDEGCLWGDYFYLEALTRTIEPGWVPYW